MTHNISFLDYVVSLHKNGEYEKLVDLYNSQTTHPVTTSISLYFADALNRLKRHEECIVVATNALTNAPSSSWAAILKFTSMWETSQRQQALDFAWEFLQSEHGPNAYDSLYILLEDRLGEVGDISRANEIKDKRQITRENNQNSENYLIVQGFNKSAAFNNTLRALANLRASEQFNLVIQLDSWRGSKHEEKYKSQAHETLKIVASHLESLNTKFASCVIRQNLLNRGPCATCAEALNFIHSQSGLIVLIEDDVVLTPDALEYALLAKEKIILGEAAFICFESILFNKKGKQISDEVKIANINYTIENQLAEKYLLINHLPSSAFGMLGRDAPRISKIRGLTRGDIFLNQKINNENMMCIMPIVPRAIDFGMFDPNGYSVETAGVENITEIKDYYYKSENTPCEKLLLYTDSYAQLEERLNQLRLPERDKNN